MDEAKAGRLYPFDEGDTDAIVIRCADPRFRRAFDAFVADLGIRHPATIAVTGSIKSFALQAYIPKEWHALRKQLELIATRHAHVTRVVLLTHDDCQSYKASAHLMGDLPLSWNGSGTTWQPWGASFAKSTCPGPASSSTTPASSRAAANGPSPSIASADRPRLPARSPDHGAAAQGRHRVSVPPGAGERSPRRIERHRRSTAGAQRPAPLATALAQAC